MNGVFLYYSSFALIWLLDFFYILFGYPADNFGLLLRGQPHSPDVNHRILSIVNLKIKVCLVARLEIPQAQPSAQWRLNQEPPDLQHLNHLGHSSRPFQEIFSTYVAIYSCK